MHCIEENIHEVKIGTPLLRAAVAAGTLWTGILLHLHLPLVIPLAKLLLVNPSFKSRRVTATTKVLSIH